MTIAVGDTIRCDKNNYTFRLTILSMDDRVYCGTLQTGGAKDTVVSLNKQDAIIYGWYKESSSSFEVET
jgi:hypothetical protein